MKRGGAPVSERVSEQASEHDDVSAAEPASEHDDVSAAEPASEHDDDGDDVSAAAAEPEPSHTLPVRK